MAAAVPANESPPTSSAGALHMRINAGSIDPARALRKIEPAYGPIRLTDLNLVGSKN